MNDLEQALETVGLERSYWVQILVEDFGTTTTEKVKNLEFDELEDFARNDVERHSLRGLLTTCSEAASEYKVWPCVDLNSEYNMEVGDDEFQDSSTEMEHSNDNMGEIREQYVQRVPEPQGVSNEIRKGSIQYVSVLQVTIKSNTEIEHSHDSIGESRDQYVQHVPEPQGASKKMSKCNDQHVPAGMPSVEIEHSHDRMKESRHQYVPEQSASKEKRIGSNPSVPHFQCFGKSSAETVHSYASLSGGSDEEFTECVSVIPSASNEIEKGSDQYAPELSANKTYELLLDKLDLRKYYPGKITVSEAISVRRTYEEKLTDLPWRIIHQLFLLDSLARDDILYETSQPNQVSKSTASGLSIDDYFNTTSIVNNNELSTLDVLVVTFSCCDSFLKQVLAQKLFICKLAIPFLYPLCAPAKPMLSLWALRGIEVNDKSVTDNPTPVVTFLRLGNLPLFSKSKLINDVLNDNNHHTFVNYQSKNGMVKKILSDGLVECSWKIQEKLSCMFLNLRGDVSSLEKQRIFLCDLSSTVVLLVTTNALTAHSETYRQIYMTAKKVIVLILAEPCSSQVEFRQKLKHSVEVVGKDNLQKADLIFSKLPDGQDISNTQMKSEIWKALSKYLMDCTGPVLQNYMRHRGDLFADVDENICACQEGKRLAKEITGPLFEHAAKNRKDILLPLQEETWQKCCKLKKDLHRRTATEGCTLQEQKEKIKKDISLLRNRQRKEKLTIPEKMSTIFQEKSEAELMFFLCWIKLMLDTDSKTNLSDIRLEYSEKWEELQSKRGAHADMSVVQNLSLQVENLEKEMAKVSIGLEHLFREIGQMFEAFHANSGCDDTGMYKKLPGIAAKLLMSGHPLELLDGDASGIPLHWIEAVFKQLNQLTVGKPVYVVSIMGVQSSGKSTLLNTMFGLQFAVSSGRCTRGAFMQLIEIHRSLGFPFSYILVIDTEGLRAPELASAKRVYDNELATLAVGLADITVINIKGENTSEVQDILQIVVYAFLRMKSANTKKYSQPKCAFIHQNVPDVNAQEKMMQGRQRLLQILDEMAKEAALGEGRRDVTRFSDVINFDVINHNWYFPDLWLGNPPMAPVNPKYSEQVKKVRDCLLQKITDQQTFLSASDLLLRIRDIWNGILCEDFIFSFRNTLEIRAYGKLEAEYNSLLWQLQDKVRSFMEGEVNTNMRKCQTEDQLEEMFWKMVDAISSKIGNTTETLTGQLDNYFKTNEYKEIIIQWKSSKSLGLENEATKQTEESKKMLYNLKETCRLKILQNDKSSQHLDQFVQRANHYALALKNRGSNMTEKEMRKVFENEWRPFIKLFQGKEECVNITSWMSRALCCHFSSHKKLLQKELSTLEVPLPRASLVESMLLMDDTKQSSPKGVMSTLQHWFEPAIRSFKKTEKNTAVAHLEKLTTDALSDMQNYIDKSYNPKDSCTERKINAVVHHTMENLTKIEREFILEPDFKVKVAVLVARYAVQNFQKAYNDNHSIHAYLQRYEESMWSIFRNTVKNSTEEIIAGELLCHQLEKVVIKQVQNKTAMVMRADILDNIGHSKFHLLIPILEELANCDDFQEFTRYIENCAGYASQWLIKYTNGRWFAQSESSKYSKVAIEMLQGVFQNVSEAVSSATESVCSKDAGQAKMLSWIEHFCKVVDLPLSASNFHVMSERDVSNFENLKKTIGKELTTLQRKLIEKFRKQTASDIASHESNPHPVVFKRLWGCTETCPFCKEPCSRTDPDHYKTDETCHLCIKHKPKGVKGNSWDKSNKLNTQSCGFSIHQKDQFKCGSGSLKCRKSGKCTTTGSDWVWHKYEDYKELMPEWDIQPDDSDSMCKYWQWFMAKYSQELTEYHGKEPPDIPDSWHSISKEDAIRDLRSTYGSS